MAIFNFLWKNINVLRHIHMYFNSCFLNLLLVIANPIFVRNYLCYNLNGISIVNRYNVIFGRKANYLLQS